MEPISALLFLVGSLIASTVTAVSSQQAQISANESNKELTQMANQAQLQAVRETNEFNAAQAQIDRDRQDTTMQRAMADYSAAGLNPLLAAQTGGSVYSTPVAAQGNVAQIKQAHVNPAGFDFSGMASAFSSMSNTMLIQAMLGKNAQLRADTANLNRLSREAIAKNYVESREAIARANRAANSTRSIYRYDRNHNFVGSTIIGR